MKWHLTVISSLSIGVCIGAGITHLLTTMRWPMKIFDVKLVNILFLTGLTLTSSYATVLPTNYVAGDLISSSAANAVNTQINTNTTDIATNTSDLATKIGFYRATTITVPANSTDSENGLALIAALNATANLLPAPSVAYPATIHLEPGVYALPASQTIGSDIIIDGRGASFKMPGGAAITFSDDDSLSDVKITGSNNSSLLIINNSTMATGVKLNNISVTQSGSGDAIGITAIGNPADTVIFSMLNSTISAASANNALSIAAGNGVINLVNDTLTGGTTGAGISVNDATNSQPVSIDLSQSNVSGLFIANTDTQSTINVYNSQIGVSGDGNSVEVASGGAPTFTANFYGSQLAGPVNNGSSAYTDKLYFYNSLILGNISSSSDANTFLANTGVSAAPIATCFGAFNATTLILVTCS